MNRTRETDTRSTNMRKPINLNDISTAFRCIVYLTYHCSSQWNRGKVRNITLTFWASITGKKKKIHDSNIYFTIYF